MVAIIDRQREALLPLQSCMNQLTKTDILDEADQLIDIVLLVEMGNTLGVICHQLPVETDTRLGEMVFLDVICLYQEMNLKTEKGILEEMDPWAVTAGLLEEMDLRQEMVQ